MLNLKHMNSIYRISSERLQYNWEQDMMEKTLTHLTVGILIESILEFFPPNTYFNIYFAQWESNLLTANISIF